MIIREFNGNRPAVHNAYIADDVSLIGDVEIGENASVWYGTVLRGDVEKIKIGENTSIQDNAVSHCASGYPTVIGNNCVIGHGAIIHSCIVEDGCLIGMGAVLLDGCRIGAGSIVAAGAVVSPHKIVPPRSMVMGVPGRIVRSISDEEVSTTLASVEHYLKYAGGQMEKVNL